VLLWFSFSTPADAVVVCWAPAASANIISVPTAINRMRLIVFLRRAEMKFCSAMSGRYSKTKVDVS
jgi:hypothetical protein